MAASALTKNNEDINMIKQTISYELSNGFCENMCHTDAFIELCEGTKQMGHGIPRNSCLYMCQ